MKAIPLQGPEAAMALATQTVAAQQNHPGEDGDGVRMMYALREALQTIVLAASFVTYIQDEEDPCLVMEMKEAIEVSPPEILRRMADSFEEAGISREWDSLVEEFRTTFRKIQADVAAEGFKKMFPGDINISDILGEGKQ